MVRSSVWVLLLSLHCSLMAAQSKACDACRELDAKPMILIEGLGALRHPVSTKYAMAQRFFDQGLRLIYAFNHEEAVRSFRRAAELDPELAMAHWGVGLALGPNINAEIDMAQMKRAHEAAQQAVKLAKKASPPEQAYIDALTLRYSDDKDADFAAKAAEYSQAMRKVSQDFPDDLDAATLFAESAMNLRPWKLWTPAGEPAEGTLEIVATLESVLQRDPDHTGANHYYIHAVEASRHPERALSSADRLGALAPIAGHLVHMPAHVFVRVGDYAAASRSNELAVTADRKYFEIRGPAGMYAQMYFSHNLHFLAYAKMMQGRGDEAIAAADELHAHVEKYAREMPLLEFFVPTPLLMRVRFRQWQQILEYPEPAAVMHRTRALWHFARGVARAEQGDVAQAKAEEEKFATEVKASDADAFWGLNSSGAVLEIAGKVLAARIFLAEGKRAEASESLRAAIEREDSLSYDEPPSWYLFPRETLGAILLQGGQSAVAEKHFRKQLEKTPRSGRALFGLIESLKAQQTLDSLPWLQAQFDKAWRHANERLRLEEY